MGLAQILLGPISREQPRKEEPVVWVFSSEPRHEEPATMLDQSCAAVVPSLLVKLVYELRIMQGTFFQNCTDMHGCCIMLGTEHFTTIS